MDQPILIVTTGGTIDKVYFDEKSTYEVGEPQIGEVLERSDVVFDYSIATLCHKDSLELTDDDRRMIHSAVSRDPHRMIVLTHGTDTMAKTARSLQDIPGKVIVLTGSMQPAAFRSTDAALNLGLALAAVQRCPPGVYIAMSGQVFDGARCRKDPATDRFEAVTGTA